MQPRAARLASLAELSSLLRAGWVSFIIQNEHAQRLVGTYGDGQGAVASVAEKGYEQAITDAFPNFNAGQRELHNIIRGITIHALRQINLGLLEWVKKDAIFEGLSSRPGVVGELARKLSVLEAHLFLWHAKYEIWIPSHPEHALVYLGLSSMTGQ
jgi:hypothetical protein